MDYPEYPKKANRVGGRPRRVFDVIHLQQLREQGLSYRKIAAQARLGEGTVRRALRGGFNTAGTRQNPVDQARVMEGRA